MVFETFDFLKSQTLSTLECHCLELDCFDQEINTSHILFNDFIKYGKIN